MIKETCREFLYYFNYCSHPNEDLADSTTTFFEYGEDQHDAAKLEELFGGYLAQNASVLKDAGGSTPTN